MKLLLLKGKEAGDYVHYVAKVLQLSEDGDAMEVNYLRCSSQATKDTFKYPPGNDVYWVDASSVLGVLTVTRGATKRLANLVKISPALTHFSMR